MDAHQEDSPIAAARVMQGGGMAVFLLTAVVLWNALMLALLLLPASESAMGSFASDFRRLCLEADSFGGTGNWAFAIPFLLTPAILGAAVFMVYRRVLPSGLRRLRVAAPAVAAALAAVALGGAGLYGVSSANAERLAAATPENAEFPARLLRTRHRAPQFTLLNHEGEPVSPSMWPGRIVVLTAVYATCPHT
jgi:hypothetical protein